MSKIDPGIGILPPDVEIPGGDIAEALVFDPTQCATFNLIKTFIFPDAILNTSASGEWLNYGDGSTPASDQLLVNSWVSGNLFSKGSGKLMSNNSETHKIATLGDLSLRRYYLKVGFYFANDLTTPFLDVSPPMIRVRLKDDSYYSSSPLDLVTQSGYITVDISDLVMDIIKGNKRPWEDIFSITFTITLNRSPTLSGNKFAEIGTYESTTRLPTYNSNDVLRGNSDTPFTLNMLYVI